MSTATSNTTEEDVLPERIMPDGIKLPVPKKKPKAERAALKKKIAEEEAAEEWSLPRDHYSLINAP